MCGIVFMECRDGTKRLSKSLLKRYNKQSSRGKEGYGCVCVKGGVIKKILRSVNETGMRNLLSDDISDMILFHHRRPTSTPNIEECTHPIHITHNEELDHDYLVVHNGVISNAGSLRDQFERRGYVYSTVVEKLYRPRGGEEYYIDGEQFNDSESFAIDIVNAIEEGSTTIKSVGSIAFVVMQFRRDTKEVINIYYGRNNSNPLKIDRSYGRLVIASEGIGVDVDVNRLYKYNISTSDITSTHLTLGYYKPPEPSITKTVTTTLFPQIENRAKIDTTNNIKSFPLQKGELTIMNKVSGVPIKKIEFQTLSGKLNRTSIPDTELSHITEAEWDVYINHCSRIIDLVTIREGSCKTIDVDFINKKLKELHMDLKTLSDNVNKRIKDINNKF